MNLKSTIMWILNDPTILDMILYAENEFLLAKTLSD